MSTYFTKPSSLAKFVLARAVDINTRMDAVEAGFDAAEAAIDALVGTVSTQASAAAASAAAALASETAAAASETAAAASASAASSSASSASSSASTATTQASNASTSASNAATSASNASTSETNAATSETNAGNSVTYAAEWANKAEDSLVSSAAGGDQVDDYSALHFANKAAGSATAAAADAISTAADVTYAAEWANKAEDSLISVAAGGDNVDDYSAHHHANKAAASAAAAAASATAIGDEVSYAAEWANKAEDSLVSAAAGGDQVDDYSALHHAAKAAASAAAAATFNPANYVEIAGDTMTGAFGIIAGTVGAPGLFGSGDTDTGVWLSAANTLDFSAGGVRSLQLATAATGVNYVVITPAATTADPDISAAGSDTNINLNLTPKGTGTVGIAKTMTFAADGSRMYVNMDAASYTDRFAFQPDATNVNGTLVVLPSGTNVQAQVIPFNSTDPANGAYCAMGINGTNAYISTAKLGTGSDLPLHIVAAGTTAQTISTDAKTTFKASGTAAASINVPAGTKPTTPAAGDIWNTQYSGLWFYANSLAHNLLATNDWTSTASAATVDLGAIDATCIEITGTTSITSFGTSAPLGTVKILRFTGALNISYNPTGHLLAGSDVTTQAGDIICVAKLNSISGWYTLWSNRYGGGTVAKYYTAGRFSSPEYDAGNSGTSLSIAWANGGTQKVTLTGNVTFTFSSPIAGIMRIKLVQGAGPYTVTWPTIKWKGGTAPTLSAGSGDIDIVTLYYDGTSYHGVHDADFATP